VGVFLWFEKEEVLGVPCESSVGLGERCVSVGLVWGGGVISHGGNKRAP